MTTEKLCELAHLGKLEDIQQLLTELPSLATKQDQSGRSLLHWAISGGHGHVVDYLFQHYGSQIPVDCRDDMNWTPLMIAASAGRQELVTQLIGRGAAVSAVNSNGQAPLHYAASKDRFQIAEQLLEHGADASLVDNRQHSALHRAAAQGHVKMAKLLLSYNSNVNGQDCTGNTPLHMACEDDQPDMAKLLVDHGASLTIQNRDEKTPIDVTAPGGLRRFLQHCLEDQDIIAYVQ